MSFSNAIIFWPRLTGSLFDAYGIYRCRGCIVDIIIIHDFYRCGVCIPGIFIISQSKNVVPQRWLTASVLDYNGVYSCVDCILDMFTIYQPWILYSRCVVMTWYVYHVTHSELIHSVLIFLPHLLFPIQVPLHTPSTQKSDKLFFPETPIHALYHQTKVSIFSNLTLIYPHLPVILP